MARLGVTYQDVENAANQILGQGKQPTIELIRQLMGTGSSTTIANHLRKWRMEQDGTLNLSRTENLPKEMIALMKGLWDGLCHHAQGKVIAHETKYQQNLAELEQELQKYKTNNQRWQQLFNQWTKEKDQLTTDKFAVEQAVEHLQKEKLTLETKVESQVNQLQEKQDRIEELHKLHSLTQTNLEHYRESVREQRMIEQQQFEQYKLESQAEIKRLKEQAITQREKLISIQNQYQLLQQTHTSLEKTHAQVESQLREQQINLATLEKTKNESQYASQHWQEQALEYKKIADLKHQTLADTQAEMKVLLTQLADVKKLLDHLQDQNKLLGHEKWLLTQEKAQLEGQLKQMQKIMTVS